MPTRTTAGVRELTQIKRHRGSETGGRRKGENPRLLPPVKACFTPKGIAASSPRLQGTSYLGKTPPSKHFLNPDGVVEAARLAQLTQSQHTHPGALPTSHLCWTPWLSCNRLRCRRGTLSRLAKETRQPADECHELQEHRSQAYPGPHL
jgi:hypothetical protein